MRSSPDCRAASGLFHIMLVASIWLGSEAVSQANAAERTRFLFFGPAAPFLFDATLSAGGYETKALRSRYAAALFETLDTDGDGKLSAAEAAQIPRNGRWRANADRLQDDWQQLDASPQDRSISLAELEQFIFEQFGPELTVEVEPPRLSQTVRLHSELDRNGDGRVSRDEIETGFQTLWQFDFDDDETLSVAELQPYPLAALEAMRQAEMQDEPPPLLLVQTDEERKSAAARMVALYGTDHDGQSRHIPLETLAAGGIREAFLKRFDRDRSGGWSAAEIELYLKHGPAPLVMSATLAPSQRVELVDVSPELADNLVLPESRNRRPLLRMGGVPVECVARNRLWQATDAIKLYQTRFFTSDADRNGYLDVNEFAGLQAPAPFSAVDIDGNEQITRREIQAYFELEFLAAQSRLVAMISDRAVTLFDILDENADKRLSEREFLRGSERIKSYDATQDDALAPSELTSRYAITFTQPQVMDFRPTAASGPMSRQPIVREETSGPVWFRRMDRNRDGELSWREFLGPRETFDELDRDGDGWIERDEAEFAERLRSAAAGGP